MSILNEPAFLAGLFRLITVVVFIVALVSLCYQIFKKNSRQGVNNNCIVKMTKIRQYI